MSETIRRWNISADDVEIYCAAHPTGEWMKSAEAVAALAERDRLLRALRAGHANNLRCVDWSKQEGGSDCRCNTCKAVDALLGGESWLSW